MFKKSNKRKKEEIDNELRPKDSVNNRKKFIIPSVKKKQNKEKNKKKDENSKSEK